MMRGRVAGVGWHFKDTHHQARQLVESGSPETAIPDRTL